MFKHDNLLPRYLGILASQVREAKQFVSDAKSSCSPYRNHPETLAIIKQEYRERIEDTFEHLKFSLGI